MYYIFCILLIAYGIFSFFKPETVWHIQHSLSVEGGEPTELALFLNKAGGVGFVIAGILLLGMMPGR